jgi:hypothetical protein
MKGLPEGGTRQFGYAEPPTLNELMTHAEKFGSLMVFETATEYLTPIELLKLSKALDEIDTRAEKGKFRKTPPRRVRMDREMMRALVVRMTDDRIPQKRIAEHLGVSPRMVWELLDESRKASEEGGHE